MMLRLTLAFGLLAVYAIFPRVGSCPFGMPLRVRLPCIARPRGRSLDPPARVVRLVPVGVRPVRQPHRRRPRRSECRAPTGFRPIRSQVPSSIWSEAAGQTARPQVSPISQSFQPQYFTLTNYTFLLIACLVLVVFFVVASRKMSLVPRASATSPRRGSSSCATHRARRHRAGGPEVLPVLRHRVLLHPVQQLHRPLPGVQARHGHDGHDGHAGRVHGLHRLQRHRHPEERRRGLHQELLSRQGRPLWLAGSIFGCWSSSPTSCGPLTLVVRLFANMYAGPHHARHLRALRVAGCWSSLGGVEASCVLPRVASCRSSCTRSSSSSRFIQAYVFAILTAVYIGGALHAGEH